MLIILKCISFISEQILIISTKCLLEFYSEFLSFQNKFSLFSIISFSLTSNCIGNSCRRTDSASVVFNCVQINYPIKLCQYLGRILKMIKLLVQKSHRLQTHNFRAFFRSSPIAVKEKGASDMQRASG